MRAKDLRGRFVDEEVEQREFHQGTQDTGDAEYMNAVTSLIGQHKKILLKTDESIYGPRCAWDQPTH